MDQAPMHFPFLHSSTAALYDCIRPCVKPDLRFGQRQLPGVPPCSAAGAAGMHVRSGLHAAAALLARCLALMPLHWMCVALDLGTSVMRNDKLEGSANCCRSIILLVWHQLPTAVLSAFSGQPWKN